MTSATAPGWRAERVGRRLEYVDPSSGQRYVPAGGKSRAYVNPATGETISRRQLDQRVGRLAGEGPGALERQARERRTLREQGFETPRRRPGQREAPQPVPRQQPRDARGRFVRAEPEAPRLPTPQPVPGAPQWSFVEFDIPEELQERLTRSSHYPPATAFVQTQIPRQSRVWISAHGYITSRVYKGKKQNEEGWLTVSPLKSQPATRPPWENLDAFDWIDKVSVMWQEMRAPDG